MVKKQSLKRIRGHYENLPDGKGPRPAVTHVIQETLANSGLLYWYGKVGLSEARRVSEEAKSFGSAMHKIVARYLKGGQPPLGTAGEDIRQAWNLWYAWLVDSSWDEHTQNAYQKTEEVIFNDEYAGTCDWFTGSTLFDWKFGNRIYESHKIQLGAYAHLLGAEKGIIVRVSKKEKNIETLEMGKHDLEEAYEVFRHLLAVFNWKKRK